MEPSFVAVGIDVSKDHLDVALLGPARPLLRRQANLAAAFPSLLAWIQAHTQAPVHVCLEATGTYHEALLAFLLSAGLRVSVLPSNRLKAFRESEGMRSKTDKLDALLLAKYCQQKAPALYVPLPEDLAELRDLLSRLLQLEEMRQQERNRLGNARLCQSSQAQLLEHIALLSSWMADLLKQIRAHIKEHEALAAALLLLRTIPGIGERTGWHLLVLLGSDASRFPSPRHLVLFVGVDVARRDSGKRKAGQISKRGPAHLRGCLGMAAIVSKRWDADMQQWATELRARGKKGRQVRVAIMRKLLHLAYGVLRSGQPYDPVRAWPTHGHGSSLQVAAA
jgi:transposase